MITDFDKILNELSFRVNDGMPDLTNEQHLIKLWAVLKEYNWPVDERARLLQNLTEGTTKKLSYNDVGKKLAKIKSVEQQGTVDKKVYGDIAPDKFIRRIKATFSGATNVKSYDAGDTVQEPTGTGKSGPKRMSSKARWFTWKWKGNNYDIGLMPKDSGGRGAKQTKDQELSWMLVLSGMQW